MIYKKIKTVAAYVPRYPNECTASLARTIVYLLHAFNQVVDNPRVYLPCATHRSSNFLLVPRMGCVR